MKRQLIRFAFLLAVCALVIGASAQAQKGKTKVSEGKVTTTAHSPGNSGQCKAPRPPNRGCKIACKPCFVPVCENGKWKYEKIEVDKEQCRPPKGDQSGACKIGATEYCPPSCKTCIRQ
jgi:hypothetical protein